MYNENPYFHTNPPSTDICPSSSEPVDLSTSSRIDGRGVTKSSRSYVPFFQFYFPTVPSPPSHPLWAKGESCLVCPFLPPRDRFNIS
ncbi:hypothetical protein JTE90_013864 [Oedothorax gibbosus]|uniref:Uncharacterized protein n=1 Tax=Oedothorax gibbosus TaxID=931172 RepID=A0AAV6VAW0_9ARAC|nr:hypothetical protein JTE90_013864 [Oedothorax gibbosus]